MFGYVEEIGLVPTDIPGSGPGGHLHSWLKQQEVSERGEFMQAGTEHFAR